MRESFKAVTMKYINRSHNIRANLFPKLANSKNKGQHHTVVQMTLDRPTVNVLKSKSYEYVHHVLSCWGMICIDEVFLS